MVSVDLILVFVLTLCASAVRLSMGRTKQTARKAGPRRQFATKVARKFSADVKSPAALLEVQRIANALELLAQATTTDAADVHLQGTKHEDTATKDVLLALAGLQAGNANNAATMNVCSARDSEHDDKLARLSDDHLRSALRYMLDQGGDHVGSLFRQYLDMTSITRRMEQIIHSRHQGHWPDMQLWQHG